MLYIETNQQSFIYDISEIIKIFYPNELIESIQEHHEMSNDFLIRHMMLISDHKMMNQSTLFTNGEEVHRIVTEHELIDIESDNPQQAKKYLKRIIKNSIFKLLKEYTNLNVPWGSLTGIRPTKLVREMKNQQLSDDTIKNILSSEFFVEDSKATLLLDTVKNQQTVYLKNAKNNISIYIAIPFCKSRCLYCSFPSYDAINNEALIAPYIDALLYEILSIGKYLKYTDFIIDSVYIGGGTPTSISAFHLKKIMDCIKDTFDTSGLVEFTVEAGRPDTIDIEKLTVLKKSGVNRISINPQTMNLETLLLVGRMHTPEEIIVAYKQARNVGFTNINMDIIIGLPGETLDMVEYTLQEIYKLQPENLTVHTLAIKRASKLKSDLTKYELPDQSLVEKMLNISQHWAAAMEMHPYYLYRQKYMMGNMENVGYSKPNKECIYNIHIMEEDRNILAFGAGAISKIIFPIEHRIERIVNVKNVSQYITRIDEMIQRKNGMISHS